MSKAMSALGLLMLTIFFVVLFPLGCDKDTGDDDTTEASPTVPPSPTPGDVTPTLAPTPTPVPVFGGQFRVNGFLIADAGVGFDLDGDGTPDNVLPTVFDELYDTLEDVILLALTTAGNPTPEETTAKLMALMEEKGLVINAVTINENTTAGIDSGKINYLLELDGESSDAVLTWWDGFLNVQGDYVVSNRSDGEGHGPELGIQEGSVNEVNGDGELGPGFFRYEPVNANGDAVLSLDVIAVYSTFSSVKPWVEGGTGGLQEGMMGGAIPWTEIETIILDALDKISAYYSIDAQDIADEVKYRLESVGLIDVTVDNQDAFSCAFTYSSIYQPFIGL